MFAGKMEIFPLQKVFSSATPHCLRMVVIFAPRDFFNRKMDVIYSRKLRHITFFIVIRLNDNNESSHIFGKVFHVISFCVVFCLERFEWFVYVGRNACISNGNIQRHLVEAGFRVEYVTEKKIGPNEYKRAPHHHFPQKIIAFNPHAGRLRTNFQLPILISFP